MSKKTIIILALLAIAALVIIVNALPKQRTLQPGASPESAQTKAQATPRLEASALPVEEREYLALNSPGQDASIEEKDYHFKIAQSIAEEAPYLNITNCQAPEPLVLNVKFGEALLVKNGDSVDHTISTDGDQAFLIAANSSKSIQPNFGKGPGVYGYGCDGSLKEVGLFLATL